MSGEMLNLNLKMMVNTTKIPKCKYGTMYDCFFFLFLFLFFICSQKKRVTSKEMKWTGNGVNRFLFIRIVHGIRLGTGASILVVFCIFWRWDRGLGCGGIGGFVDEKK